jgi:GntR family transcriptional repressor for pyruvate dehydrogenase complex
MFANTSEPPRLSKVLPVRIFEQAVEQIRDLIASGAIVPGEKLPTEQDLGRQFNVSRSSVREALRVLEAEGLVEVKRGLGTFVCQKPAARATPNDLSHWLELRGETLEQVLQVREAVEGLTAALAAVHASAAQLDEIRAIVMQQERMIAKISADGEEQAEELSRLDVAFHLAIGAASGNDIANEIISHIIPAFQWSNRAVLYLCKRAQKMDKEHNDVLSALEARDPAAAETAMRNHISRVRVDTLIHRQTG